MQFIYKLMFFDSCYNLFMSNVNYTYGYARALHAKLIGLENKVLRKVKLSNYYVIRVDGKRMTKAFKDPNSIRNEVLEEAMKKTICTIIETFPFIKFVYRFSDEISMYFSTFNITQLELQNINSTLQTIENDVAKIFNEYLSQETHWYRNRPFVFDYRILNVTNKIDQYFRSRQAFVIDKFIIHLKYYHDIDRQIKETDFKLIIQKLKNKNIDYYSFPLSDRNGMIAYSKGEQIFYEGAPEFEDISNLHSKYMMG